MNDYFAKNIICPFFEDIKLSSKKIMCEGVADESHLITVFKTKKKLDKQLTFCCDKYKECPVAIALFEKYKNKK